MASFYNKTAKQLLVDLINEGNPDMPFPINMTDYDFTRPEGIEVLPNGHNTQIRVIAKPTAPYTGNVLLTYRRINLASLFRGVIPEVKHWVSVSGYQWYQDLIQLHDLLNKFSKKYGILLEKDQIRNVGLDRYNGDRGDFFNIYAENDSLVFVGYTQAKWTIGKRTLEDLLEVDDIEGRVYPDGNDFSEDLDRRPYLTPLFHNTDFTMYHQENGSNWNRYDYRFSGTTASSYYRQYRIYEGIMDSAFRQAFGFGVVPGYDYTRYDHAGTGKDENGDVYLHDIRYYRISLPDARYPEANSEFFNSAIVIEIPEDCPWGVGNIYFHYNK